MHVFQYVINSLPVRIITVLLTVLVKLNECSKYGDSVLQLISSVTFGTQSFGQCTVDKLNRQKMSIKPLFTVL